MRGLFLNICLFGNSVFGDDSYKYDHPCFHPLQLSYPCQVSPNFEYCLPEGQMLYQCCHWQSNILNCREGTKHPCIDNKHTCGDKFCHRKIKPNEFSQAYECIDEDEKCLGIVMCEEYFFGHCAWGYNINNATQAISVTSLDDCYNHCKNIEGCTGFDLDEKGICIPTMNECTKEDVVDFAGLQNYTHSSWANPYHKLKRVQSIHYPMKGCKTPKRSPDCDKKLADTVREHFVDINDILSRFEGKFDEVTSNQENMILDLALTGDTAKTLFPVIIGLVAVLLVVRIIMLVWQIIQWKTGSNTATLDTGNEMRVRTSPRRTNPDVEMISSPTNPGIDTLASENQQNGQTVAENIYETPKAKEAGKEKEAAETEKIEK